MSNTVLLGDIASLKTGPFGTQLSASEYVNDGIPVINVRNIGYGEIITSDLEYVGEETAKRLHEHLLRIGDIVFGRKGSVDRHAFIDTRYDGWMQGSDCIRVRINEGINPHFISHYLKLESVKKQINSSAVGSTMASLNTDILGRIQIVMPSLETQNRVEKLLSVIEEKIDLNKHLCTEMEAMAKTLYDYWFVQFDFPDENGKPYRTSGGAMEWCQKLGREVPKGWKVGKYSNLIESVRTGLNPRQNFTFSEGGIRYLTVKNLTQEGRIDFAGCDTIDENARVIVHRRSDISIGDVLFASIAPLGRCYLIQSNPDDWDINESVFSLRPNYSNCTSDFLYLTLKSDQFIAGSTNSSTGSIFKGIRINTLLDMTTLIPPIDTLNTFSDQVSAILHKQESLFSENEQLTHIRDWLLPMLMNGQAKVIN